MAACFEISQSTPQKKLKITNVRYTLSYYVSVTDNYKRNIKINTTPFFTRSIVKSFKFSSVKYCT